MASRAVRRRTISFGWELRHWEMRGIPCAAREPTWMDGRESPSPLQTSGIVELVGFGFPAGKSECGNEIIVLQTQFFFFFLVLLET